ncbi:hypothetical protein BN7_1108 [Wickerhamomyces ciferrii]|uniref:RGS domain-containing protein n=1 Tax=Wickerhamomyces ciferrii (strain ATCC 14091 / BCRC 22168 / CBS 111 / JCM 3599 / NBRC 0793 / NRRL Y-1031 F-60-10) TaxID=1206466 RepID=K0KHB1_WICCF|nr:uncharacterized protein BN7_1108 [Wickerhamomyces ciferrii]CCH41567.1 hypothetical protein BN7_1108 [Wickerhamomyces ciferrii]
MTTSGKNIPSLENLINQCCEHYYSKLNEHVEDELNITSVNSKDQQDTNNEQQLPNQYYSYAKFQDFINASYSQENLKFLIEIYHYEKIWNKTFKRQSSILKCKEEEPTFNMFSNSRKQSVATIRTMNSRRSNRHPSIVEEGSVSPAPHQHQTLTANHDSVSPVQRKPSNVLSNNDLDKLVQELSLPKILKSGDEFDNKSFVNQDMDDLKHSNPSSSSPSPPNGLKNKRNSFASSRSASKRNTEVWDSLFKPSYICEKNNDCQCHHSNNSSDSNLASANDKEVVDALEQQEILEQNKIELQEKFEYIIQDYVINNSPYQINLPDTVYSNLLKEYENNKILYHSPLTLLPAKNAVLQLLRENIYYNFLTDQENLINKNNSKKIITKMDELKISNSSSTRSSSISQPAAPSALNSSSNPTSVSTGSKPEKVKTHESIKSIGSNKSNISTRSNLEINTFPKKKKSKDSNLGKLDTSKSSNSSEESFKSKSNNTPISTISNFLNKYHIKIHNNTTQSNNSSAQSSIHSASNNNSESSSINSLPSPISPIQQSPNLYIQSSSSSGTRSRELNTNFIPKPTNTSSSSTSQMNSPLRQSIDKNRHSHTNNHGHGQGSSKYVKGPCGIEPELNDYDPKPPKHSWSRLFNKKSRS